MNGNGQVSGKFLGKSDRRDPVLPQGERLLALREIAEGLKDVEQVSWRGNRLVGMANGTPFAIGF